MDMSEFEFSDDDRPFSPHERKQLRDLIEADKRRLWMVSSIKAIALWIAAVAAAISVFGGYAKRFFSAGSL